MSLFKLSRRALVILGLVGLAATASATEASAFGFGGGGHFGGFGGGHFGGGGGGRFSGIGFGHFDGGRFGMGGWNRRQPGGYRPAKIECFRAPCNVGGGDRRPPRPPIWNCRYTHSCGNPWPPIVNCRWTRSCGGTPWPPIANCRWTHTCGGVPVPCRYTPWASFCRPQVVPPVVVPVRYPTYAPAPSYAPARYAAVAPTYSPAPTYAPAPAATPAYAPPATCVKDPTIWIVFQPAATANDISALLKGYNVTLENGPDANSVYRLRVSTVPSEQIGQLIEALRAQTTIVNQVGA